MIDKYRDKLDEEGVSPVIGVILLVAVTVALVALATVIVFDIGSDVSGTADASVQMEQTDSGVQATIVRNENVDEFILRHEDGTEQSSTKSIGSFTYDNGDGEYTLIAVVGGNEEVIRSKTVVGAESGESSSGTVDAKVDIQETSTGISVEVIRNENINKLRVVSPDGSSQTFDSDVGSSHTIEDGEGSYSIVATLEDGSEETIRTITSSADSSVLSGTVSYNSPVEGVLVESYDSEGDIVDSDLTNANGVYNVTEADELRVNNFTASYGDVDLNTVADNGGTSVPSILMNGDGSSSSPYEIRTASDLQAMQEDRSANYIVVNDIDASGTVNWNNGQGFNPVGTYDFYQANSEFTGSFDGQNHTISNLSINRLDYYVGLFGRIGAGGEVKNVGVINVNITGESDVGGLVGDNDEGTVSNSYSTGNVTGESNTVGGLVGANDGNISNSYSTGNVTGESNRVGGLVGANDGNISNSYSTGNVTGEKWVGSLVGRNSKGNISNSNSTGNVVDANIAGGLVGYNWEGNISNSYSTGNVTGAYHVGGLVGRNDGTVSNSYSTGNVTGESDRVGGLVGYNTYGTVSNSYSTGNVTGEKHVGGLVGYNNDGSTISNSYSTGNVTGEQKVGGLVGENYATVSNSYSTGNVTGGEYVGGLVGENSYGNISNSYSTGNVTGGEYVGGLVGRNNGNISDSYWDTEATGQSSSEGLPDSNGLTTSEMQGSSASSNMSGFDDFTDTWSTVTGDYPELQWQE
jgi:flagellin-like protein